MDSSKNFKHYRVILIKIHKSVPTVIESHFSEQISKFEYEWVGGSERNISSNWNVEKKPVHPKIKAEDCSYLKICMEKWMVSYLMTLIYPFAAATWRAVAPDLQWTSSFSAPLSHMLASRNIISSSLFLSPSASIPEPQTTLDVITHQS